MAGFYPYTNMFSFSKVKNELTKALESYPKQVLWMASGFFLIGLSIQIWRIESLSATFDQALFHQLLWSSSKGHLFQSSLSSSLSSGVAIDGEIPSVTYLHLGQHLNFLTLLGVPFVSIFDRWGGPILQIGLLSIAGIVLWNMASARLEKSLALRLTLAYYLSGTVIGPAVENFHDFCWYPLIGFLLINSLLKEDRKGASIYSILFLLIREDSGITLFSIGLWALLRKKNIRIISIFILTFSFIYVLIMTSWVQPSLDSSLSERFLSEKFGHLTNNASGGTLPLLWAIISKPKSLLIALVSPPGGTLAFLLAPSIPLALIPIFSVDVALMVALPLFIALISQGMSSLSVTLRYVMALVPGLFAGTMLWLEAHPKCWSVLGFRRFWTGCLALGLSLTLISNPNRSFSALVPDSFQPWVHVSAKTMLLRANAAKKAIALIPNNASISADTPFLPLIAEREAALRFPENIEYRDRAGKIKSVDWILASPNYYKPFMPLFQVETARWKAIKENLISLVKQKRYGIFHCQNGVVVLKKDSPSLQGNIICMNQLLSKPYE